MTSITSTNKTPEKSILGDLLPADSIHRLAWFPPGFNKQTLANALSEYKLSMPWLVGVMQELEKGTLTFDIVHSSDIILRISEILTNISMENNLQKPFTIYFHEPTSKNDNNTTTDDMNKTMTKDNASSYVTHTYTEMLNLSLSILLHIVTQLTNNDEQIIALFKDFSIDTLYATFNLLQHRTLSDESIDPVLCVILFLYSAAEKGIDLLLADYGCVDILLNILIRPDTPSDSVLTICKLLHNIYEKIPNNTPLPAPLPRTEKVEILVSVETMVNEDNNATNIPNSSQSNEEKSVTTQIEDWYPFIPLPSGRSVLALHGKNTTTTNTDISDVSLLTLEDNAETNISLKAIKVLSSIAALLLEAYNANFNVSSNEITADVAQMLNPFVEAFASIFNALRSIISSFEGQDHSIYEILGNFVLKPFYQFVEPLTIVANSDILKMLLISRHQDEVQNVTIFYRSISTIFHLFLLAKDITIVDNIDNIEKLNIIYPSIISFLLFLSHNGFKFCDPVVLSRILENVCSIPTPFFLALHNSMDVGAEDNTETINAYAREYKIHQTSYLALVCLRYLETSRRTLTGLVQQQNLSKQQKSHSFEVLSTTLEDVMQTCVNWLSLYSPVLLDTEFTAEDSVFLPSILSEIRATVATKIQLHSVESFGRGMVGFDGKLKATVTSKEYMIAGYFLVLRELQRFLVDYDTPSISRSVISSMYTTVLQLITKFQSHKQCIYFPEGTTLPAFASLPTTESHRQRGKEKGVKLVDKKLKHRM